MRVRAVVLVYTALLLAAPPVTAATVEMLQPSHEEPADASFAAFRAKLDAAIMEKSEAKLKELLAPDVKSSFGDDDTVENFFAYWLGGLTQDNLWSVLSKVLALGGVVEDQHTFSAPYVFARFPHHLDPFETVVSVKPDTPVRKAPSETAEIIGTAAYSLLPMAHDDYEPDGWTSIVWESGVAWVSNADSWSGVGPRLIVRRNNGRWLITALVEGD